MMIKADHAIETARSLLGTPYSEMDCIALIRAVIRQSPGGVRNYRCEGTNWLWDSVNNSGKYRHLTERHEGIGDMPAGALAFKRYGADGEDHVGIATDEGTVIHSSSVYGRVVETLLTKEQGWDCWGRHRNIAVLPVGSAGAFSNGEEIWTEESERKNMTVLYRAKVVTRSDPLNVRQIPQSGAVIGRIPRGETVHVLGGGEWPRVRWGDMVGYASGEYLERIEEAQHDEEQGEEEQSGEEQNDQEERAFTSVQRASDGAVVMLAGRWSIVDD